MIMSANRNQQAAWAAGNSKTSNNHPPLTQNGFSSLRRPAPPTQPAPKPTSSSYKPVETNLNGNFRSQTLNRLDLFRARQQRAPPASLDRSWSSLRRNPAAPPRPVPPEIQTSNIKQVQQHSEIYAPASIASPNEFVFRRPDTAVRHIDDSNHYAATSCRNEPISGAKTGRPDIRSESLGSADNRSSSGRESALGNLWAKFGTFRRKSRLLSLGRRSNSVRIGQSSSRVETPTLSLNFNGPPPKVTYLDPEIYAAGKKQVQAEEIYAEGLIAIDGNSQKRLVEYEIDETLMVERERRVLIEERSKQQADYKHLVRILINWINDELSDERIIVKDLQDDLCDGHILCKLMEKLLGTKMDLVEITQNLELQRYKLETVVSMTNRILRSSLSSQPGRSNEIKWSVEGIHLRNMVEIIYLLIALAQHFRAPIKIPANICVQILIVEKYQNQLIKRSQQVQLTYGSSHLNYSYHQNVDNINNSTFKAPIDSSRDVFDTLVDYAPEKLELVKQSLVNFTNKHLNKIKMSCLANKAGNSLDPDQFSDGLLLVFLISSLEGYFVPLGELFTTASTNHQQQNNHHHNHQSIYSEPDDVQNNNFNTLPDLNNNTTINETAIKPNSYINTQPLHKLHNVNFALQLMEDVDIMIRQKVRPEDIVNGDLKSVLRVLYALFSRYKHL